MHRFVFSRFRALKILKKPEYGMFYFLGHYCRIISFSRPIFAHFRSFSPVFAHFRSFSPIFAHFPRPINPPINHHKLLTIIRHVTLFYSDLLRPSRFWPLHIPTKRRIRVLYLWSYWKNLFCPGVIAPLVFHVAWITRPQPHIVVKNIVVPSFISAVTVFNRVSERSNRWIGINEGVDSEVWWVALRTRDIYW